MSRKWILLLMLGLFMVPLVPQVKGLVNPSVDTSCSGNSPTTSSASCNLTTTSTNDIILIFCVSVNGVLSTPSGSQLRIIGPGPAAGFGPFNEYYIYENLVATYTFTCTTTTTNIIIDTIAVKNVLIGSAFDTAPQSPCINSTLSSVTSLSCNIYFVNSNDLLILEGESEISVTVSAGSCCTLLHGSNGFATGDEYLTNSPVLTNSASVLSISFSSAGAAAVIGDALTSTGGSTLSCNLVAPSSQCYPSQTNSTSTSSNNTGFQLNPLAGDIALGAIAVIVVTGIILRGRKSK
jgi:hypothetical protein